MSGESVARGVYGPLPARFEQTSGVAEHAALAVAVLRRVAHGSDERPTPVAVDYQSLFRGVGAPARAISGSYPFSFFWRGISRHLGHKSPW
eukprot:230053-Pyramimonas_sp.AAC.1